nr:hypothetical protein [Tanacetum cinerariifolium]
QALVQDNTSQSEDELEEEDEKAMSAKFVVKRSGDVTRLQALVDKKKIDILQGFLLQSMEVLDSHYSSIFDLVRNVDSSSKLYMYPRFIQLIIQTNIADLSTHTTRYISPDLTQKVPAQGDNVQEPAAEEVVPEVVPPTSSSPSSPLHQPPCPPQPQDAEGLSLLFQQVLATCSALALRVKGLEKSKECSWYPLSRFTLEQLVNVARLQVEEESEMSLELLSESKDCQSNIDAACLRLKPFKDVDVVADVK